MNTADPSRRRPEQSTPGGSPSHIRTVAVRTVATAALISLAAALSACAHHPSPSSSTHRSASNATARASSQVQMAAPVHYPKSPYIGTWVRINSDSGDRIVIARPAHCTEGVRCQSLFTLRSPDSGKIQATLRDAALHGIYRGRNFTITLSARHSRMKLVAPWGRFRYMRAGA